MWEQTARLSILAAASLLAAAAGAILSAQEPAGVPSPQDGVLLMRNGQVIEGKISPAGDFYYVALPSGQLRLRASDVELVCRDIDAIPAPFDRRIVNEWLDSGKVVSVVHWCTPGATTSRAPPKLLPHQYSPSQLPGSLRSSQGLVAPTAITSPSVAG